MNQYYIRFLNDHYSLIKIRSAYVEGVGIQSDEFLIVKTKWWLVVEAYLMFEKLKGLVGR